MLKKFKVLTFLAILMVFALVAAGCNNDGGSSVDVGIVLPTKDEPRWVQDEQRFKDALADSDYSTEILFSFVKSTPFSNFDRN